MNNLILITTPSFSKYDDSPKKQLINYGFDLIYDYALENFNTWPLTKKEKIAGIIVGLETIDNQLMSQLPNLKIIIKHGAGVDNIDLISAEEKGIIVHNAPGANARAVAELALGLMLAVSRSIVKADGLIRKGEWGRLFGFELKDKVLSIIGFGAIGRELALIAQGVGMRVVAYDVLIDASAKVDYVSLDEALSIGDYISLHTPLLPSTRHLINENKINLMKNTAFIINTGRGGLIDEDALINALNSGKIAGAALDAFEYEPNVNPKFKEMDNVVLTSHIGAFSVEATKRISQITADHIVNWGETCEKNIGR